MSKKIWTRVGIHSILYREWRLPVKVYTSSEQTNLIFLLPAVISGGTFCRYSSTPQITRANFQVILRNGDFRGYVHLLFQWTVVIFRMNKIEPGMYFYITSSAKYHLSLL